jgi:hypothetical protein
VGERRQDTHRPVGSTTRAPRLGRRRHLGEERIERMVFFLYQEDGGSNDRWGAERDRVPFWNSGKAWTRGARWCGAHREQTGRVVECHLDHTKLSTQICASGHTNLLNGS